MKRTIIIGIFVTVLLTPLSGCAGTPDTTQAKPGGGTGSAGSAPSPSPKPVDLFAKAVTKFSGQNAKYTIGSGDGEVMTGHTDGVVVAGVQVLLVLFIDRDAVG